MQNSNSFGGVFSIIKGVLLALAAAFLSTIIIACIMRICGLPDKAVYPILQTVKTVLVLAVCILVVRGEKGWLKGGAIGLIFTALSYLTFSAVGGDFSLTWLIFVELGLAVFAGVLGGIIGVNMRR